MKIRELIKHWEEAASEPKTAHEYSIKLPIYDAAKVAALVEMYPGRTEEQILTDLLSAALSELSASFAYVAGAEVISHDDQGDPIYEDEGLTPRFHQLSRVHARRMLGNE